MNNATFIFEYFYKLRHCKKAIITYSFNESCVKHWWRSLNSFFDKLLQFADAWRLLLRGWRTEGHWGPCIWPWGGSGQPLSEELQHTVLLTALQSLRIHTDTYTQKCERATNTKTNLPQQKLKMTERSNHSLWVIIFINSFIIKFVFKWESAFKFILRIREFYHDILSKLLST